MKIIMLFLLCAGMAQAGDEPRMEQLKRLAWWELTFAHAAETAGMRTAFIEFFAEDGIIFRPEPVNARKWFENQDEMTAKLRWQPAFVEISLEGDMGLSTGPWSLAPQPDQPPAAFGWFITIWGRQSDGSMKALIDTGTVNLPPEQPLPITTGAGTHPPNQPVTASTARAQLIELDRKLSNQSINQGFVDALGPYLGEDVRIMRAGISPVSGRENGLQQLGRDGGLYTWQPIDGACSRLGDFGYTYGNWKLDGTGTGSGHYLRVWVRNKAGQWRLALDALIPLPAR